MDVPLELPATIGRYVLEGKVASGGMATVYHGRMAGAAGFMKTVAIKRMHPHCMRDPDFVAMFLDEANLAARIRHPNVVAVLESVTEGDSLIMVMEYVAGDTLDHLLRSARSLHSPPPHRVLTAIMAGVLEGLHAAHDAVDDEGKPLNIVHRDVSPQNIIVGFDGIARVLDFGVAKATVRLQTTRAGQLKGRLRYMAPEQVRSRPVDRRSDVYATSVVAWEAFSGHLLFDADNEGTMLLKVLEGNIPSLRAEDPTISPTLEEIVLKGLRGDPAARFQTAQEMAVAIERAVGIASPQQVAEWVRKVVPPATAQRTARIAGLDLDSFGLGPQAPPTQGAPAAVESAAGSATGPIETCAEPQPPKKTRIFVTAVGVTALMGIVGFWIALHEVSWLGPTLIDVSRAVFGVKITAWIEGVAHSADSGWSELWQNDERAEAIWNIPSASASASTAPLFRFRPVDLQPMISAPFARGDGSWVPTQAPTDHASPYAYRMALHPDGDRMQAIVRVVAFDYRRTKLEFAPARDARNPASKNPTGLVASHDVDALIATIHGSRRKKRLPGLGFGGKARAPSSPGACTVAATQDGALHIDLWSRIDGKVSSARRWFRQMPACLVLSGSDGAGLDDSVGDRRLALGLSANGKTLYWAAGNFVSDASMARVLRYAGARRAASFGGSAGNANIYFYARGHGEPTALCSAPAGAEASGDHGVATPSKDEFFYVVRSAP